MAVFYTNFSLRGPKPARVVEVLRAMHRDAFAASVGDATVVCDRMADAFDTAEVEAFARVLSTHLRKPVLTAINHYDEVLLCVLHAGSELIFQYTSDRSYFGVGEPGPHGDDASLLAKAFRREAALDEICRVLGLSDEPHEYASASARHAALCDALGLPLIAVGVGYDEVAEKRLPPDAAEAEFRKV
jgi:class 3 adenylate cyclase